MAGSTTSTTVTTDRLVDLGRAAGLAAVGVAEAAVLEPARTVLHIRKRAGRAGDMQFTYRNPDRSTDPETVLPGARSLVAGALSYGGWPGSNPVAASGPVGRVARYTWHDHYHTLTDALRPIADALEAVGHRARIVADTNALVDRNVAWSAGLGWYGKNSNLLLPGAGSWYVLGAVVTDAVLTPTGPPVTDGCGSCRQCIDDCPTGAIVGPGVVDATRCLAWIVQAPGPIPPEYRAAVGDRLYGCDDCQDVCPPNRTVGTRAATPSGLAPAEDRVDLRWLLTATDEDILDRHGRWYIAQRNVDFVRRTALVVLGNVADPPDPDAVDLLRRYLRHDNPLLRAHAAWAARRLGCARLLDEVDGDEAVDAERQIAVEARFTADRWDG